MGGKVVLITGGSSGIGRSIALGEFFVATPADDAQRDRVLYRI